MNILRIVIVVGVQGTDSVNLYTDMPSPMPKSPHAIDPLVLRFEATRGYGEEYARKIFPGVPVEVIDVLKLRGV